MEPYQSRKKVRIVGILDLIATVALVCQIISCTWLPVWTTFSQYANRGSNSTLIAVTMPPPLPPDSIVIQADTDYPPMNTFGGTAIMKSPSPRIHQISDCWLLSLFGMVIVHGVFSMIAIGALIRSTSPNMDPEKALSLTRLWMHWNIVTFFLAAMEFMVVLILPVLGIHVGVPIPTLVYIGLRSIFTCIVFQELNTISSPIIMTLDANVLEEKRIRALHVSNKQREQPGFVEVPSPAELDEIRVDFEKPGSMQFRPKIQNGNQIPHSTITLPD